MKENRGRNEVVWSMYQDGMTYQQMAKVLKISRQRTWAIVQNGIKREMTKRVYPQVPIPDTIDKK